MSSIVGSRSAGLRTLVCVALATFFVAARPHPGAAHDAEGSIIVDSVTSTSDGLSVVVEVKFLGDGHRAPAATVTVVAERTNARKVGPRRMRPKDTEIGLYESALLVANPEEWTYRFTSLNPAAYLEVNGADLGASLTARPGTDETLPATSTAPKPAASSPASAATTSPRDPVPAVVEPPPTATIVPPLSNEPGSTSSQSPTSLVWLFGPAAAIFLFIGLRFFRRTSQLPSKER
jgi:hypothetical protein